MDETAVAIIGMAGRFPGADDVDELWQNLRAGVESVRVLGDDELLAAGVGPERLADADLVKAIAMPRGIDRFDAAFFGYSHREAEVMDPQQRLLLECAYEALENAGHGGESYPYPIGVFAGASTSTYLLYQLLANPAILASLDPLQIELGNSGDYVTTRISHKLNLTGPSCHLQTACSTSLVAVHFACQSLLAAECDMALAGGVSINVAQLRGYSYQPGGISSSDGHCRAFDARAEGAIGGSGVGLVVLKRLADALADGDPVRAVIRGTAINNDGAHKVGFTAPSVTGQAKVIAEALAVAGVSAAEVSYVEAHGTGTTLGDRIEIEALRRAFDAGGARQRCALGSIKTNLGHLATAAGIAGLIKAVLALEHRTLPPSLHFEEPNPAIGLAASPFYVNVELAPWPPGPAPRRAGVSSFGMGGTNAHVVLEEAPPAAPEAGAVRPYHLLLLSARSEAALAAATTNLAAWLRAHPELDLADVAHTLWRGRRAFEHRRALVCRDRGEAIALLAEPSRAGVLGAVQQRADPGVAFLFPGLGDQHLRMAGGLYAAEPAFRAAVDRSCELLAPQLGVDLREVLYPAESSVPGEAAGASGPDLRRWFLERGLGPLGRGQEPPAGEPLRRLDRTLHAQPATFVVEHALARLWMDWGVTPRAMLGYSLGEVTAACIAGVLSLEDALWLVAERARLIEELPAGAMLAVPLPESEAGSLLGRWAPDLSLAAINAPEMCVVAGTGGAVAELEQELACRGVASRRVRAAHAFHSRLMAPAAERLAERARRLRLAPPRIPFLSNLSGTWITDREATDPSYWARHLCQPVRFAAGLGELLAAGHTLLEVGPGATLGTFARQHPASAGAVIVHCLGERGGREDHAALLEAVGRLWLAGTQVDAAAFFRGQRRRRVALPTYPFERQRYWIDAAPAAAAPPAAAGARDRSDLGKAAAAGAPPADAPPAPALASTSVPASLPGHARPLLRNAYVPPRDETERTVAALWQTQLGVGAVGVHDDFFELGGHSFLATRLVAELRRTFGCEVQLPALFATPTVAGFAAVIAAALAEPPPGAPVESGGGAPLAAGAAAAGEAPLSFAQERLWFLDRLQPGSSAYNLAGGERLVGPLDPRALAAALVALVNRHESLRTTFSEGAAGPVQRVAPPAGGAARPAAARLPLVDLRGLAPAGREAEAARLAVAAARAPFDLERGPLLRTTLLRLDPGEHLLLLSLHHIAGDAWSLNVLRQELAQLYAAAAAGQPPVLPAPPISYAEFAREQRQRLVGDRLAAERAWWRRQLAGAPECLELPTDRPRASRRAPRGGGLPFRLGRTGWETLCAAARRDGATPFMALVAGFMALLSRASGQLDVSLGTPSAGRDRDELEGVIGLFVNTLVLRLDLSGDPAWSELLRRARGLVLGALAHQQLPFEKLVTELAPRRSLVHSPLFQVLLALQPAEPLLSLAGLRATRIEVAGSAPKFDLSLSLEERDGALAGAWEFDRELFDGATITRLGDRLARVLASWPAAPDLRLSTLPLLDPAERQQLLVEWNDTRPPRAAAACLPELFAVRALAHPEVVAVTCEGEALSYGELAARVQRLAGRLRGLGVGPETVVAIALERSAELVTAVLAVLAAGAAYLPLDPEQPAGRLRMMVEDSRAGVLLTEPSLVSRLPSRNLRVVLARDAGDTAASPPPGAWPQAEGLAYVIYTSGSTGRPKGVQVTHVALVNLLSSMAREPGLGAGDTLLALTTISFDIAALEIFLPLLAGARLVLVPRAVAADGDRLRGAVECERPTVMQATPAGWRLLLDAGWQGDPALRALCGGEALPAELAERLLGRTAELWNVYGPTEATIWASAWRVAGAAAATVPIGRPVDNTRIVLLDRELGPVPIGVTGELYIGGVQVARGYLGRAELSAERFVPDPFGGAGERLYRTGDLARRLAGGEIEFLGRVDQQVKIRGFRIEPAEVEAALAAHPQVRQAVVVAPAGAAGERRLVAYLVARDAGDAPPAVSEIAPPAPGAVGELRSWLRTRLPEHMVPSAFVWLTALPLTPSGKVDRRALPAPAAGRQELAATYREPRGAVEETVAGVWCDVLGVERVGADDSFFDLGGHSLLAMRMIARLRAALGLDLPLRELFEEPVLSGLAARVALRLRGPLDAAAGTLPPLVPLAAGSRCGGLPASFAQERMWFLERLEPSAGAYHIAAAFTLAGDLEAAALRRALAEVVRRHEALRTTFAETDGRILQAVQPPACPRLPIIDLTAAARRSAELSRLAGEEAARPFDLGRGPLLRVTLVRLGERSSALLVTLHHIVADGWSVLVLIREVGALYAHFTAVPSPPSIPLPPLPVQYADYSSWQRGWLRGDLLAAELAWWRERLAGLPPEMDLPFDRPRPAVARHRGLRVRLPLPEVLAPLSALARSEGATLFMALLGAFQVLLGRFCGTADVPVGTPIANRSRPEVEHLIGLFVNTLVLRGDLAGAPPFTAFVGRVRAQALAAYAHQELPFEKLVEALAPERGAGRQPLFQALFTLPEAPLAELRLPGLTLAPLPLGGEAAKLDLALEVTRGGGELTAVLDLDADLFEAATGERLLRGYQTLLAAVASAPLLPVNELPLLAAAERRQVLEAGNDTTAPRPDCCLHELFEAQAKRTPAAVALSYGGRRLTYRQLDLWADRLALLLRRRGVGADVRVGVCAERSFEMIVALLAVLKAGGAFVPLDPDHPPERLAYEVEQSGTRLVLVEGRCAERLPRLPAGTSLLPLAVRPAGGGERSRTRTPASALAYVMFTSGSSGRPKGVMVSHRAIVNLELFLREHYPLSPADTVLQITTFSFDAATREVFTPLLAGARVVIAPPGDQRDPSAIARLVAAEGVTVLQLVPSMLGPFLDAAAALGAAAIRGRLRLLTAGGEPLPGWLAERAMAQLGVELLNLYGPTECTVDATHRRCRPGEEWRVVPIGLPLENVRVHVLDEALQPLPPGAGGELYAGGVCLARGYAGRPDLTADRFVPDPWSALPGERLYRTGDRVRRLPGGEIAYLGRVDEQVKVRGARVELGEIESVLLAVPGVSEAAVAASGEEAERRLVAYVVAAGSGPAADPAAATASGAPVTGPADLVAALRRRCQQVLPAYMVPSGFVLLERLPRLTNGKLNRRALPAAPAPGAAAPAVPAPPGNPLEEILGNLWAEVLGRERVGMEDDFFADLGGHSLLAVQVVSRVRERLGLELPLRSLFDAPTVRAWAAIAGQPAASRGGGSGAGPAAPAGPGAAPDVLGGAGAAPDAPTGAAAALDARSGADAAPGSGAIPRRNREGALPPLSFAQERLWFLDQLTPGLIAYNMPLALRLQGRLEVGALADALGRLVERHEVLRTRFRAEAGRPVQEVLAAPAGRRPLPVVDLRGLARGRRGGAHQEAARLAAAEARRAFDLGRDLPLRASLLCLRDVEHLLLLTLHHIAADGWSLGVLAGELGRLYAGEDLPALPIQYADYAVWQRQWLRGEALAEQLAHWRRQLAGVPALELPADRPRPAALRHRGGHVRFELPKTLLQGVKKAGRETGATLFMTLLAGFQVLLARHSGQQSFAVGTAVANRGQRETEGLIGLFVNTLALHAPLAGEPSWRELLARLRAITLGAYGHQEVPFERVVEELQPARDTSRAPLVQVSFLLQNAPVSDPRLPGLTASAEEVSNDTCKLDLLLSAAEESGRLVGEWEYDADLFDAATVDRLASRYRLLVAAAAADPAVRVSDLPWFDDGERRQVLVDWNRTAVDWGAARTLHELFAEQAARMPDAVAVMAGERSLSYGALAARANRLAHLLRRRGVGPETLVGLCLERGPELVVAVLAVLAAGGAYLPLDPSHPPARLASMIEDAAPRLVLAARRYRELAGRAPVCCIDDPATLAGMQSGRSPGSPGPLLPAAGAGNAAYVIFTSGSTGRPKGVVVEHRGLCNLLLSLRGHGLLEAGRALLAVTTLTFDIAGLELFLPLLAGGTVALATREESVDPDRLRQLLADPRVQAMQATPATWSMLLQAGWTPRPGFRALCGGEALAPELAARLLQPGTSLWNLYGPTETTIWSTVQEVTAPRLAGTVVPIGRPLANTRLLVLDAAALPLPAGVPGELYIGGEGVARGYLHRPELTAERFVPDAYGPPGGRLYRTGDRVRWRAGGVLDYLGRLDHQVKLRGFRIEPGEIEAALRASPLVREAVVVLREDAPYDQGGQGGRGGRRLVAYLVPAPATSISFSSEMVAALRRHCQDRLPAHMVPSAFVVLERLPLTPNGKLDRRALPAPETGASGPAPPGSAAGFVAPATPLEEIVAGIWAEVLGRERVGAQDDFFADLGGHSLLATQVVARARERLGLELPLRSLFEAPTVAAWTARMEQAAAPAAPPLVRLGGSTDELPLSFAQERLWFLEQLSPGLAVYHLPLAVRLRGRLDRAALSRSVAGVVRRHEALRTRFHFAAGRPVQIVVAADDVDVMVPVVDLRSARRESGPATATSSQAREVARLVDAEAGRLFDLASGPLLRGCLLWLEAEEHLLLLTLHHIASDGWSLGVLIGELGRLYAGDALPALPVQYPDYALWQRQWLRGDTLESQLAWWRGQLAGLPVLQLPTDRPRPAVQSHRGGQVRVELPAALAEPLRRLGRAAGVTPFMVLLSGFQLLLARTSGQLDVVVGTAVANRRHRQLEGLIGCFVNTLVLRADLGGEASFRELLARVREVTLGAYGHQDVPFEKLVEDLRPARDTSQNPLVQVMLVLQNAPQPPLHLPGLELSLDAVEARTARLDLSLALADDSPGAAAAVSTSLGISGALEYDAELFDLATVRRLAGHFRRLLAAAVAAPDGRAAELPLLDDAERRQVVEEWNRTASEARPARSLHELVAEQARRSPAAVAVACRGRRVSYGELWDTAERLAERLRRGGVAPGHLVAVCMERSPEMVAALLGVLMAGAAYVPLDPGHPAGRRSLVLTDARVACGVTTSRTLARIGALAGTTWLRLDAAESPETPETPETPEIGAPGAAAAKSAAAAAAPVGASALAYVIYTSGSTGTPKGVAITHGNAVAFLGWCAAAFPRQAFNGLLASTSINFDLSVFEIFGTLSRGGTVVLADDLFDESAWTGDWPITLINTVPSLLDQLLASRRLPPEVGIVNLAGEPLSAALVRRVRDQSPATVVMNLYGPTEATTYATWALVAGAAGADLGAGAPAADAATPTRPGAPPPIGRPVAGTRVYVLDAAALPLPEGVPGELYIGGAGVAGGYLHRPELTAERFVPDGFGPPGERLYRTGDRVRWRAGGVLEYLGRLDHQVKLRGFRIEPGEIEAALRTSPLVGEAVVVLREDKPGDLRLVAYVTPAPADAAGPVSDVVAVLRDLCRERLPAHMVPAGFVVLERLPLTPNGKVDRRALPAPDAAASGPAAGFVAPRSELERAIAALWQEVLRVEKIGIHDNFFDLGGHSLLVVSMRDRLRERLGQECTLVDLFRHGTVASLAAFLQRPAVANALPRDAIRTRAAHRGAALRERRPFRPGAPAGMDRPAPVAHPDL
jgi:amino acid adenylation domain-containing protein